MTLFMILLDYKYRQTSRMAPPRGPDARPEVRKAERAAGNAGCILISSNARFWPFVRRADFFAHQDCFRIADYPGMIGKGNSDLRDLPQGGTWMGIIRKLASR